MIKQSPVFDTELLRPGIPVMISHTNKAVSGSYKWPAIVHSSSPLEIRVINFASIDKDPNGPGITFRIGIEEVTSKTPIVITRLIEKIPAPHED